MADAFRAKFTVVTERVTIGDLANEKPKRNESTLDYINRWRNLWIQCDRKLDEYEAVDIVLKNIDSGVNLFLGTSKITKFEELIRNVSNIERNERYQWLSGLESRVRRDGGKKADTKATWVAGEIVPNETIAASSDGVKGDNADEENKQQKAYRPTLAELKSKPYSFKKDRTAQLFKDALKHGLELPTSKRPGDAAKSDDPNYCPYHRVLGHPIEECYVFKNWVERMIHAGKIPLSPGAKQDPAPHEQSNVISHFKWNYSVHMASSKETSQESLDGGSCYAIQESESDPEEETLLWGQTQYDDLHKGEEPYEEFDYDDETEEEPVFIGSNISGELFGALSEDEETPNSSNTDTSEGDSEDEAFFLAGMFQSDECSGKETHKVKEAECQVSLRSGTCIPERQPPKETGKMKDKGIAKEIGESSESGEKNKYTVGEYNVLAHLRKIPALLSVFDALMLSKDLRDVLIYALQNPEKFQAHLAENAAAETLLVNQITSISFNDDDLLVGTSEHNRPLYVTGEIDNTRINRVLIDPGSSINILPLKTLKRIALSVKVLSNEKIFIHGFDQRSQQALGAVTLPLQFGSLNTQAKFHVIDADTSYKALLGRPWLHENGVVPSTLHQCMKYVKNGKEKKISGDESPFEVYEISLDDARYFLEKPPKLEEKALAKPIKTLKPEPPVFLWGASELSEEENWGHDALESDSEDEFSMLQTALAVERMPNGCYKELTPREVDQVQRLHTLFVPPKVEYVNGKRVVHPGILFYKAATINSENEIDCQDDWSKWLKDEDQKEKMVRIIPPQSCGKRMKSLFKKTHYLDPIPESKMKMFQDLWNGTPMEVKGVDGETKYTCGLGFKELLTETHVPGKYDKTCA